MRRASARARTDTTSLTVTGGVAMIAGGQRAGLQPEPLTRFGCTRKCSARYASRSNRGVCFIARATNREGFFRVYEPSRIFESRGRTCVTAIAAVGQEIDQASFQRRTDKTKTRVQRLGGPSGREKVRPGPIGAFLPPSGRASVAMAGGVPPHAVFLYGVAVGAALAANALRRRMRRRLRALCKAAPRVRVGLEVRACG